MELCCRPYLDKEAIQRFRSLVKDDGVHVNCIDETFAGRSPLLLLLYNNTHANQLQELINFLFRFKLVNVNLKDYDGWSAHHIVCRQNFNDRTHIVAILSQLFVHGSNDFGECVQLLRNRKFLSEAERINKIYSEFIHGECNRLSRVSRLKTIYDLFKSLLR